MKTVAIVEPHEQIRESLIQVLAHWGYKVTLSFESDHQIIAHLMSATEFPGICILNVNIYNMDGFRTAKKLRDIIPNLKIILYANDLNEKAFHQFVDFAHADYYVDKNKEAIYLKRALDLCCRKLIYINTNKCNPIP